MEEILSSIINLHALWLSCRCEKCWLVSNQHHSIVWPIYVAWHARVYIKFRSLPQRHLEAMLLALGTTRLTCTLTVWPKGLMWSSTPIYILGTSRWGVPSTWFASKVSTRLFNVSNLVFVIVNSLFSWVIIAVILAILAHVMMSMLSPTTLSLCNCITHKPKF